MRDRTWLTRLTRARYYCARGKEEKSHRAEDGASALGWRIEGGEVAYHVGSRQQSASEREGQEEAAQIQGAQMTPEHKPSDLDLWARACERVGKWKRGECRYAVPDDGLPTHEAPCGEIIYGGSGWVEHLHDIPVPPIGEAECVVAMWNYLVLERGCRVSHFDGMLSVEVPCRDKMAYEKEQIGIEGDESQSDDLYMANMLAAAVVATPKESV